MVWTAAFRRFDLTMVTTLARHQWPYFIIVMAAIRRHWLIPAPARRSVIRYLAGNLAIIKRADRQLAEGSLSWTNTTVTRQSLAGNYRLAILSRSEMVWLDKARNYAAKRCHRYYGYRASNTSTAGVKKNYVYHISVYPTRQTIRK